MSYLPDVHIACNTCGVQTCLSRELYDLRQKDSKSFYCPNGHSMYYETKPTEDQKRIKELERELAGVRNLLERISRRENDWMQMTNTLRNGIQVCPLGCGWRGNRRMTGFPPTMEDYSRFMDRAGGDLVEHLLEAHNATRAPVALLTTGDSS